MAQSYLNKDGLSYLWSKIKATFLTEHQDITGKADKSATVSTISYDSTNNKITQTINGTTTDVVTIAQIKSALGLIIDIDGTVHL